MEEELRMFINALHGLGVLLAIIAGEGRWTGICVDKLERYWIVEGAVTSAEVVKRDGLNTTDHCYMETYDDALAVFRVWWDNKFVGAPPNCSEGGKGLRPV